ncbi:helix-turn-helix transcriptional regulator [Halobium salinum]|uniref:Helix-turn-helix transcriptional regulator n=1 Tax=Halobium salinum TaxID=1364940 RepID=A0ABD5PE45_9EURY|nr:hypothetical protein [Halobium salinum]
MQRSAALLSILLLSASLSLGVPGALAESSADGVRPAPAASLDGTDAEPPRGPSAASLSSAPGAADWESVSSVPDRESVSGTADPASLSQASFDRNRVVLTVYENGSAEWTFHYRRTLGNESERQNFEAFATEFNSNRTSLYRRFRADSRALTGEGQNVTGREMNATKFSRQASVTNTTFGRPVGVVEMSFLWTGFAAERGGNVVVGDVFEGGLYLGPQQTLVISPGPAVVFESVDPEGTPSNASSLRSSDSVTWQGEKEFTDNRPRVVFVPADRETGAGSETGTANGTGGSGPTEGTNGSTGDGTTPPGSADGGLPILPISVGVLLVAVVAAAVWWYRDDERDPSFFEGESDEPGRPGGADGTEAPDAAGVSESDAGDGGATAGAPPGLGDGELLSDEDRVVSMLRDHGGRMKQVKIVDQTGWSKSKVSMLLSDMEESGDISKLRVGRENVISLKGHEPDAAGSPFDGES